MKTVYHYAFVCIFLLSAACTKSGTGSGDETSTEDSQQTKAAELSAMLQNKSFRLTSFYSDKPIDFDESDGEVKQETDLWAYVRPYVKDDINAFQAEGVVTISQGDLKWPGDNAPQLQRNYAVSHDKTKVYVTFVDYNYDPLKYTLSEFNSTTMLLYVDGPQGTKLFSKFEKQ